MDTEEVIDPLMEKHLQNGHNRSVLQSIIAKKLDSNRTPIGDLDYSDKLDLLTDKAMREADKILSMKMDKDDKQFAATIRAKVATIATVFTTQVRVNEGMFKQRQSDTLAKLLETLSREEQKINGDQS
jgi:hypothetical protein